MHSERKQYDIWVLSGTADSGHKQKSLRFVINETSKQLDEYLAGQRKIFIIPINEYSIQCQEEISPQLVMLHYGTDTSYKKWSKGLAAGVPSIKFLSRSSYPATE